MIFSSLEKIPTILKMFIQLKTKILKQNDTFLIVLPCWVSQIWQTFAIEVRDNFAKTFKYTVKTWFLQFLSLLLLQTVQSPLRIYLNVIITLNILSGGFTYPHTLQHFNLKLDQLKCANTFDLFWRSIFWRKWAISPSFLVLLTIFIIDIK